MNKQRTYEQGIIAGIVLTALGLSLYESFKLLYSFEKVNHTARRFYRARLQAEEHNA